MTFEVERDLRNEDHVCAAGDARVERDPARVSSHHLDHHHAAMRFRGGVQAVDRVGREADRRIEAEGQRPHDVVVDGLGHAHDRNPELDEAMGNGERAVAADDDQRVEREAPDRRQAPVREIDAAIRCEGGRERVAAVGRAENRAAHAEDARDVVRTQHARASLVYEAVEAVFEADALPAEVRSGLHDRADDGVEAGGVAAAGEDANAFERSHGG